MSATPAAEPTAFGSSLDALRLGAGTGLTSLCLQLVLTAMSVAIAKTSDATPFMLGILTACGTLPFLIFGFHAGAVVDKYGPSVTVTTCLVALGVGFLIVAAAAGVIRNSIAVFLIASMLVGTFSAFGLPALSALLAHRFSSTERGQVVVSVFRWRTVGDLSGIVIAGAAVTAASNRLFLLGAACSAAALVVLWPLLRSVSQSSQSRPASAQPTLPGIMREGGEFLARTPPVLRLLLAAVAANLGQSMVVPLLYIYLARHVALETGWVSAAFALPYAGLLLGTVLVRRLQSRLVEPIILTRLSLVSAAGVWLLLGAFAPTSLPVVCALLLIFGVSMAALGTSAELLRLSLVPTDMQGRMASLGIMASRAVGPVGAIVGGAAATQFGISTMFLTAAAVILASAVVAPRRSLVARFKLSAAKAPIA